MKTKRAKQLLGTDSDATCKASSQRAGKPGAEDLLLFTPIPVLLKMIAANHSYTRTDAQIQELKGRLVKAAKV